MYLTIVGHLPAVWPWACYINFMCPSYPICKVVLIILTSCGYCGRLNELMHIKHLKQCLTLKKSSIYISFQKFFWKMYNSLVNIFIQEISLPLLPSHPSPFPPAPSPCSCSLSLPLLLPPSPPNKVLKISSQLWDSKVK